MVNKIISETEYWTRVIIVRNWRGQLGYREGIGEGSFNQLLGPDDAWPAMHILVQEGVWTPSIMQWEVNNVFEYKIVYSPENFFHNMCANNFK